MRKRYDILIVGGGASGMVAAITAARLGSGVLVVERMRRVGKKLLATGNGRCNLTNTQLDVAHYHGTRPAFALGALSQFGLDRTLSFFRELGVAPRVEDEGKVYPASGQASSVLDVLRYEMERLGVESVCDQSVQVIDTDGDGFRAVCTDGAAFESSRVILATGGKSAPNLGSNGGGYKIARALGHTIVEPFPALVQVRLDSPYLKRLKGLKIEGQAEALVEGESRQTERGELLFTEYGISGPPILELSRIVSERARDGQPTTLRLGLFPDATQDELVEMIASRVAAGPGKSVAFSFVGLLHKRLIPVVLREAGLGDTDRECGALSKREIGSIAERLLDWRIPCAGVQSWMHSQVTAGGVDVREVDRRTLESRIVPGVYLVGELLDVDGDCGGYNLQWAWSSGYVAGKHAAER